MATPTDIVNQALDAIGRPDLELGDLQDGSEAAKISLRAYSQCLQQLLRAAHWNFSRKDAGLVLLADASGQTENVGVTVPNPNFIYEYEYPTDCLKSRFVPWNPFGSSSPIPADNIYIPNTPFTAIDPNAPLSPGIPPFRATGGQIVPARFLEAFDTNYPPATPPGIDTPGVSPIGRKVILTNVKYAHLIYTAFIPYPSIWDPMFRAGLVAYIASEIALPMWMKMDRKFGLEIRQSQEAIVRDKVMQARISDGNSDGPPTSDISVDWMRGRNTGGTRWGGGFGFGSGYGGDVGVTGYGWDSLSLASGATF